MVSGPEWPRRRDGGFSARGVRRDGADSLPERGTADRRFGAERRLRRRRDFTKVFSDGVRLNARGVTIIVRPNGLAHPRLGLVVARRVLPRAVNRHRLKRLVRESFRHNIEPLRGLDIVMIAKRGVEKMQSRAVGEHLARLWARAAGAKYPQAR